MQRFFDVVISGLALFCLLPLFVVIMVVLRFTGEGEIFYIQTRIGKGGKHIRIFKFATMLKNSPSIGTGTVTLKDDPRVLPVGRLLRSTKINELPQLFNILIGDMSIIGPRPQTERCFKAFPRKSQKKIIEVRPGLSGIGSIIFRNEEKMMNDSNDPNLFYDQVIMPYKGLLEEWYVRRQSVVLYWLCILLTLWVVVRPTSGMAWSVFQSLPEPPSELDNYLHHQEKNAHSF